jgi:hypothetical protein
MANEQEKLKSAFTTDENSEELQRVPSVTRLLNRKKLGLTDATQTGSVGLVPPPAPNSVKPPLPPQRPAGAGPRPGTSINLSEVSDEVSMVFAPNQPSQTPPPIPSFAPGTMESVPPPLPSANVAIAKVSVKVVERRSAHRATSHLIPWTIETLQSGSDPMGKSLASLFAKEATSALFLAAQASPDGTSVTFSSSAALAVTERVNLWTGIVWDPKNAPDTWDAFLKDGFIELAPLVIQSAQGAKNKALPRSAFGLENGEWGIIFRCGSKEACRGLMLVTSKKSLLAEFKALQNSFVAPMKTKLAA